jgi:N-methylhydantoinase B
VGAVLELEMEIAETARANTAGDGARHGACGLAGGKDGLPHHYRLRSGGRYRVLKTKEVGVPVHPGDVFVIESGGGGGWGDPKRRSPEARALDVENGFVTPPRKRGR